MSISNKMFFRISILMFIVLFPQLYAEQVLRVFTNSQSAEIEQMEQVLQNLSVYSFSDTCKHFWSESVEHVSREKLCALFTRLKSSPCMFLIVVQDDEEYVGFTLFSHDEVENRAILEWICIDPLYKRRGIGRQLVYNIRNLVPEIESIVLVTNKKNPTTPYFYRSLGFVQTDLALAGYDSQYYQGYELHFV